MCENGINAWITIRYEKAVTTLYFLEIECRVSYFHRSLWPWAKT